MLESSNSDHHGSGEAYISAQALVFSKDGRKIAVTTSGNPSLPEVRVLDRFYPEIEEFARAVSHHLGIDVRVLRCLNRGSVEDEYPCLYSLVASGDADQLGDSFSWMDLAEICRLSNPGDSQMASIRLECERVSSGPGATAAVPWEWPVGWGDDVREWVRRRIGPPFDPDKVTLTPIRSWSISTVARVDVRSRRLFFKASPRFFATEAVITDVVADRFPEISPKLVAVDREQGWMLMEDLGDLTLGAADNVSLWCEAVRALAEVQTGFAGDTGRLERLGLERRSTSIICSSLREWMREPSGLGLSYEADRTEKALARLVPHVELVDELCALVDSVGLPSTLDHGDLDAGNIFVRDGSPVIMDWSDASISNPLFTPALIAQVSRNPLLAGAFLECWTGFAPLNRLEEAFEASKPIAALERAFHYRRNIVSHLDSPSVDRAVLESYIPDLLDLAARGLERHG